jgi:hypothetical protein
VAVITAIGSFELHSTDIESARRIDTLGAVLLAASALATLVRRKLDTGMGIVFRLVLCGLLSAMAILVVGNYDNATTICSLIILGAGIVLFAMKMFQQFFYPLPEPNIKDMLVPAPVSKMQSTWTVLVVALLVFAAVAVKDPVDEFETICRNDVDAFRLYDTAHGAWHIFTALALNLIVHFDRPMAQPELASLGAVSVIFMVLAYAQVRDWQIWLTSLLVLLCCVFMIGIVSLRYGRTSAAYSALPDAD